MRPPSALPKNPHVFPPPGGKKGGFFQGGLPKKLRRVVPQICIVNPKPPLWAPPFGNGGNPPGKRPFNPGGIILLISFKETPSGISPALKKEVKIWG